MNVDGRQKLSQGTNQTLDQCLFYQLLSKIFHGYRTDPLSKQ